MNRYTYQGRYLLCTGMNIIMKDCEVDKKDHKSDRLPLFSAYLFKVVGCWNNSLRINVVTDES